MDGYPKNITVLENDTATFSCPPVSDLSPYLVWYAMKVENETNINSLPQEFKLQVPRLCILTVPGGGFNLYPLSLSHLVVMVYFTDFLSDRVNHNPIFLRNFENVTLALRTTFTLTCKLCGSMERNDSECIVVSDYQTVVVWAYSTCQDCQSVVFKVCFVVLLPSH